MVVYLSLRSVGQRSIVIIQVLFSLFTLGFTAFNLYFYTNYPSKYDRIAQPEVCTFAKWTAALRWFYIQSDEDIFWMLISCERFERGHFEKYVRIIS